MGFVLNFHFTDAVFFGFFDLFQAYIVLAVRTESL